jgi:hypothetical protein
MCGRYELHTHPAALALALGLKFPPAITPGYDIAPTQQVPIVRLREGERELSQVRWGLVPFWAKDMLIGNKMINARAETVSTKPGYRDAYRKMRCLIPASGFYSQARRRAGACRRSPDTRRALADAPPNIRTWGYRGLAATPDHLSFPTVCKSRPATLLAMTRRAVGFPILVHRGTAR